MPSAVQREKFKAEGRCLSCGRARDLAAPRCTKCMGSVALAVAKNRARKKNLSFSLTGGWLRANTPEHCPCCSIPMQRGGDRSTSPSIDRMDNTQGYEPSNCWIICFSCNEVKSSSLSPAQLQEQAARALRVAQVWGMRCNA